MTTLTALILATALAGIGVLHVVWAGGNTWPFQDEDDLRVKVFSDGRALPSAALTIAVSIALFGAAYVALANVWTQAQLPFISPWLYTLALWAVVVVLAARGIVEPIVYLFKSASPVYQRLDRLVYSPLCVALATLALIVVLQTST